MAASEPRFFIINATAGWDGTTLFTGAFEPNADPLAPRLATTVAIGGRFGFKALLRSGVMAALVMARVDNSAATVTMAQRSASVVETGQLIVPDDPVPVVANGAIANVTLSATWSAPLLLSPTDALTFTGAANTVELMIFELGSGPLATAVLQAMLAAQLDDSPIAVVEINAAGAVPAWGPARTYFLVNIPAGGLLTLPLVASVTSGSEAYFINIAGSYVALVPNGAETLNGTASGTIDLAGFGGAYVARAGAGYITTEHLIRPRVTLANAVDGDVEVLPALTAENLTVELDFTAYGDVELPSYTTTPKNLKYLVYRTVGTSQIRVVGQLAERINGVSNGVLYLSQVGAWVFQAGTNGWIITSAAGCSAMPVTTTAVGNIALAPWGLEEILHRLTEAAGQILTLPPLALVPVGAPLLVQASGAAKTVAGNAAETIVGRGTPAANTFAVANNTILKFVSIGTAWIVM